ncbi:redox-sensitive transcriptional activator SoxR [Winogradskya consettensis]|uniref:Redox-sensitive transcriptional activator SoxR n=2 Tax=Winogradskya TaxID=3240235 RepID=A0A919T2F0_9ACTN|nr:MULTISPECIES: redox-sensitive transcriptional activator SoxR [Actinoplanes]GIE20208.1 redox-sensitive transcriptional activator SoxR [Actinoplanes humidus]GIM83264.1 redox-sensitive transcriptional activator SoxR [Actinoplanes consettensis]
MELLTISDMAARSGVAQSALRFYEKEGLITSTRTSGNQRRYERHELRRIAFIRIAQQVGVSLEEIRSALAALPENRTPTKTDWARLSARWQRKLEERITMMERLRDQLTGCIGCGCLSLQRCSLINPHDELASRGEGPQMILNPPRE